MPARTLPNLGLRGFYDDGEDGWGNNLSADLLKLSVLVQGGVLGRVAAVPGAPAAGDTYILTAAPNANAIAVYDAGAWVYYPPLEGWSVWDRGTNERLTFDGAAWIVASSGAALPALAGNKGKALVVNADEDDVEWAALGDGGGTVQLPEAANIDEAEFNYPNLSAFQWINLRGAVISNDAVGTVVTSPQLVNGTYTHGVTAAPAGDFDVYARAAALFNTSGDYPAWSLSLRSSASGRGLHLGATPSNNTVYLQDVNDGGGFNGNRFNRQFNRMPTWYRLSRRGTLIIGYASANGIDWNKVGQWDSAGIAIDQIGVGLIPSSPTDNVVRFLHFSTTAPAFDTPPAFAQPVEYFGDALRGGRVTSDGWMEQWGTLNGDTDVVFLRPFDTVYSLQGSMAGFLTNVSGYSAVFNYYELTALGFKGRPRANNGGGTYTPGEQFRWRAIGRVKAQGQDGGAPAKYRIGGFFTRTPDAGETVLLHVAAEDFGLLAALAGSRVNIGTAPTGDVVLTVQKNAVAVGTITLKADKTATFASDGTLVAAGDLISVVAPADSLGVANVAFTLKAV